MSVWVKGGRREGEGQGGVCAWREGKGTERGVYMVGGEGARGSVGKEMKSVGMCHSSIHSGRNETEEEKKD